MKPIRVVLADDHRVVRAGVRAMLAGVANVEIVGEAADGREALELVEQHRPDVLIADIQMKGMNGIEVASRISNEYPEVRVLILSMHAHEDLVWEALHAGASGYVLKDLSGEELALALSALAEGETYLTPAVSKHVVNRFVRRAEGPHSSLAGLTPRHRETLQLIAEGHTTKQIAAILNLSVKTVDTHRTQLMERLNIHDVAGLVRYAIRHRLIDPAT
jgi:DNA-binding NarL/FixJ family response regulator